MAEQTWNVYSIEYMAQLSVSSSLITTPKREYHLLHKQSRQKRHFSEKTPKFTIKGR